MTTGAATHTTDNAATGAGPSGVRASGPLAPVEGSLTGFARYRAALRAIHRGARYRWKLNRGEIAAMLEILPVGGVAIDVGSHKGGYTYWMAKGVGPTGRVFAFEPQERVVRPMAATFASMGFAHVKAFHAGVSDHSGVGRIVFWKGSTHGASLDGLTGPDAVGADVRLVSIDDFAKEQRLTRLDFLKIDVEGHEQPALRGAERTIQSLRPAILVEAESRLHGEGSNPAAEIRDMLTAKGYDAFFFTRAGKRPMAEFRPEQHQQYGKGFYSNNFLFVPRSK